MKNTVIRSNRSTIAIQVKPNLDVVVRAPYVASEKDIETVLTKNDLWIRKQIEKMKQQKELATEKPTEDVTPLKIKALFDKASEIIPERVDYFANRIGVTYEKISIRTQKTRWGSCSSKGNLSFNCLLMLAPAEVLDYVIVHELCHRKQMNHSSRFWQEVANVFPLYRYAIKWLKTEGRQLLYLVTELGKLPTDRN